MNDPQFDATVAIVGAGPLGIELAVALKRAGVSYLHFDARQIGYTISWFPPQTRFFSSNDRIAIAGVPLQTPDQNKSTREQYLTYLRTVVQQFDLRINTYEPVTGIRSAPAGGFTITTTRAGVEYTYAVERIVLATGGTAHPRRLDVPGEDLPHVHPHWTDAHDYFRKPVLVVGGKNSAVETALRLHHAGARVALSYRREALGSSIKYWLLPEINGLMKSGRLEPHFSTVPVEITPDHVTLRPTAGGELRKVPADFVLLMTGYEADMSLCRMAGLELHGDREVPVYDPATMETSVPGIYVAGTAVGGTQDKYELFIENCHVHVARIVAHLTGERVKLETPVFERPES